MINQIELAPAVRLHAVQTDKFKTACFSVNFLRQHTAQTAALDALLPSVLLRATEQYPDIRSISVHLDELYGATFGTLVRRKGEVKLLGFYADFIEDAFLPQGESVFAPMTDFLTEVLFHPLTENGVFCTACVEGEKQNLINAIESNMNDKRSYAVTKMLQAMCTGEDYGVPRLGTVAAVCAITPESLWAYYQDVLKTSCVEIFYAGARSAQEAAALFAPAFSHRAANGFTPYATRVIRGAEEVREIFETMDVTQGKLVMGLRTGITVSDADYPALLLLNAVFGAGMTSKLFVNVREKLSLCYYAGSSIEKFKGVMVISSGIAFENYETAKQAILHELEDCKQGVISEAELESARRQVLSALQAAMDSPAQMDEFYCGMAISAGDDYPALMEKIKVLTKDDLSRAAQKLSLDTIYFLKGAEA